MPITEKLTMDIPGGADMIGAPVKCRIRKIESSNIDWIGWPVDGEPCLIVQFKGGSRYVYLGVSRQKAVACAFSASSGEYLNKRIKPHYEVAKLR
jgi:hypothetical protein